MNIESLKVFRHLAETASFTQAAQRSRISQSAVSQQIGALERHFKSTLVERSRKQFRLTREGELVYAHGKEILQVFEAMLTRVQEIKDQICGAIHLSTIYSLGLHDLPPYLKHFLATYPQVHLQVEYRRATKVYEDVLGNAADLGLVAYPLPEPRLEIVALRDDPMVLICHPRHPFAPLQQIKLSAIKGQKFIGFEPDIPTRRALDRALRERKVDVDHVMEFDNIETVKRAVEINAGISIVPRHSISHELAQQSLVEVEIQDLRLCRPLAIIHRRNKGITPAMKEFIALLRLPPPAAISHPAPRPAPPQLVAQPV